MKTTVVSMTIVLMLVVLTFAPMASVQGQGTPPAEIVIEATKDYGVDNDGDLLYEFLIINFTLWVKTPGKYRIYGTLIYNYAPIMTNNTIKDLGTGLQTIDLMFNSTPLFKSGKDGQYLLEYNVRNDNVVPPWFVEGNHTTGGYNHLDFDDPMNYPTTPAKYRPSITKETENERIVLWNEVMTVWFYYKIPRLVWFYTMDEKSRTKYFCEFYAVHGYVDRGAGRFEPENSPYLGLLNDPGRTVSTSTMVTNRSKIYGEFVSVNVVFADIPIRDNAKSVLRFANITFSLMLAAGPRAITIDDKKNYYTIDGGTQLSMNIGIEIQHQSLAMNGLALEQEIWSESSKKYYHNFELTDQSSTDISRGSSDSNDYKFFPDKDPQKIHFVPEHTLQKKPEGYYYWVNRAKVDGGMHTDSMTYQYMPAQKRLKLYLTFTTMGNSIKTVQTEPLGIGINEDGNPSLQTYVKPKPAEQPSVLITIMGWVTAVILVILPLYVDFRRAQRKLRELEEEFGEDF